MLVIINDKLTDSCGNWLLQNNVINTFCEMKTGGAPPCTPRIRLVVLSHVANREGRAPLVQEVKGSIPGGGAFGGDPP